MMERIEREDIGEYDLMNSAGRSSGGGPSDAPLERPHLRSPEQNRRPPSTSSCLGASNVSDDCAIHSSQEKETHPFSSLLENYSSRRSESVAPFAVTADTQPTNGFARTDQNEYSREHCLSSATTSSGGNGSDATTPTDSGHHPHRETPSFQKAPRHQPDVGEDDDEHRQQEDEQQGTEVVAISNQNNINCDNNNDQNSASHLLVSSGGGLVDPAEAVRRMHDDWVMREEQFRACVGELQRIAEAATADSDAKDVEIASLERRIQQLERQNEMLQKVTAGKILLAEQAGVCAGRAAAHFAAIGTTLDEVHKAAACQQALLLRIPAPYPQQQQEPQQHDISAAVENGSAGEDRAASSLASHSPSSPSSDVPNLLAYIDCSFDECLAAADEIRSLATARDRECPGAIAVAAYLSTVALPLAHHFLTRAIGSGRFAADPAAGIELWHRLVVRPLFNAAERLKTNQNNHNNRSANDNNQPTSTASEATTITTTTAAAAVIESVIEKLHAAAEAAGSAHTSMLQRSPPPTNRTPVESSNASGAPVAFLRAVYVAWREQHKGTTLTAAAATQVADSVLVRGDEHDGTCAAMTTSGRVDSVGSVPNNNNNNNDISSAFARSDSVCGPVHSYSEPAVLHTDPLQRPLNQQSPAMAAPLPRSPPSKARPAAAATSDDDGSASGHRGQQRRGSASSSESSASPAAISAGALSEMLLGADAASPVHAPAPTLQSVPVPRFVNGLPVRPRTSSTLDDESGQMMLSPRSVEDIRQRRQLSFERS